MRSSDLSKSSYAVRLHRSALLSPFRLRIKRDRGSAPGGYFSETSVNNLDVMASLMTTDSRLQITTRYL